MIAVLSWRPLDGCRHLLEATGYRPFRALIAKRLSTESAKRRSECAKRLSHLSITTQSPPPPPLVPSSQLRTLTGTRRVLTGVAINVSPNGFLPANRAAAQSCCLDQVGIHMAHGEGNGGPCKC